MIAAVEAPATYACAPDTRRLLLLYLYTYDTTFKTCAKVRPSSCARVNIFCDTLNGGVAYNVPFETRTERAVYYAMTTVL